MDSITIEGVQLSPLSIIEGELGHVMYVLKIASIPHDPNERDQCALKMIPDGW